MFTRWLRTVGVGSVALFAATASAYTFDNVTELGGTWVSKSNSVITGPGFYDPVDELLIEPELTGISYSFTDDGHYEEALYVVTSDPTTPTCPTAVLQFQHGTYEFATNGSIMMTPISVDGRQLLSEPCVSDESNYTRYSQFEMYSKWEIIVDSYHGQYRLNLYKWDGTPLQPLYLMYRPALMLPTITMNPTTSSTVSATASGSTSTSLSKRKRLRRSIKNREYTTATIRPILDGDFWWWVGMGMMVGGGAGFLYFQRNDFLKN
ncbi:chaperone for protein-folding within the ER, fungal-domain-containing protein [Limtongia smithiae]|uniref:chaperone for protein-folding within the ER, fungal-domain-containing protein n=1 Tax=Limtongia smithiae TaxID=1125753 RepID=UPI0034CEBD80